MESKTLTLTGNALTIDDVYAVAHDHDMKVKVAQSALDATTKTRTFLEKESQDKIIYGVNTGFGPMASHIIGRNEMLELQENLIRSHAVGMGVSLPDNYVLAAMVVRLNTLSKGYSGVSKELLKQIELFINHRIIPVVPEHGAVGTSGDLVQLAHIALAFIGGGEVSYKGKVCPTAKVLAELKISPYSLKPKEGLSLINGTSMMTGIASILVIEARRLVTLSLKNGALALESVGAFDDGISAILQELRPHRGQKLVAETLRKIVKSSNLMQSREEFQKQHKVENVLRKIPESVQEVYSLRCIPQIVGPIVDILKKVSEEVTIEINSVTDNPIVDLKTKMLIHGGNFHGDYMAAGIDQLKASLVKLTMLAERQTNFFMNAKINEYFPPFMNLKKPGLTLGLQGLQFVATSTTAQSQSLAFPHHVHSIPTNGDNQDVVSMGTDAALIAARVVENAYIVLAIETLTLAQTVDHSEEPQEYSDSSRELFEGVRKVFPVLIDDREAFGQLRKVLEYVKQISILDIPWQDR